MPTSTCAPLGKLAKWCDGDVAWTGRYYKACMEFADDSNIEKQCANAADQWAATEMTRLKNQARAKQLPIPESR